MGAGGTAAGYVVSTADTDRDRPAIRSVLLRNVSEALHMPSEAKFAWMFDRNPGGAGQTWLLKTNGGSDLVGTGSFMPRRMQVDGDVVPCGRISLLAVDVAHRTFGPALMIERAILAAVRSQGTAAVFTIAPHTALGICRRLGYTAVGEFNRYAKPLDVRPHLARFGSVARMGRWLAPCVNAGMRLVSRDTWHRATGRVIKPLTSFDERFNDLWTRAAGHYGFTTERSTTFLRWRFDEWPSDRPTVLLGLLSRDGTRLHGYLVYTIDHGWAHILDLFAETAAADLDDLLAGAIRWIRRERVNSVSLLLAGDARFERTLARFGFRRRQDQPQPATLMATRPGLPSAPPAPDAWFIVAADNF